LLVVAAKHGEAHVPDAHS